MYIVTGGAGFIGSHIVKALNDRGDTRILVVDDFTQDIKCRNLNNCLINDYMDRDEFRACVEKESLGYDIKAIFHQGACTDTMETDGKYMMENNFTYSKILLQFAVKRKIPFIYASSAAVYGTNRETEEVPENERPLNVYGYSKLVFDQYVRENHATADCTIVGLRYFNVYGPNEAHKGRMQSMVYQLNQQLKNTGKAKLFEGTDGYENGEQRRDFVFVGDTVKVNLFFADGDIKKGICNVGTGQSRSFNDIANTLIKLRGSGEIEYTPFPDNLKGKYQSFTQANINTLRRAGFEDNFTSLEDGIAQCYQAWEEQ